MDEMDEKDRELLEELSDAPARAEISYVEVEDWTLRLIEVGSSELPQVVLLHGGPGSLDAYTPYFRHEPLLAHAQLLSLDRPGYEGSEAGRIETSMARQAELIRPLLRPGAIVVGHSFGATVAARLAMDYPELIGGAVLVSGTLSPVHERRFFFTRAMERRMFNWILGDGMRMANAEKFTRIPELEQMAPLWDRVTAPVILIHGTNDRIVPHPHSEWVAEMLGPGRSELRLLDGERHFILWSEVEMISATILELIDRLPVNE